MKIKRIKPLSRNPSMTGGINLQNLTVWDKRFVLNVVQLKRKGKHCQKMWEILEIGDRWPRKNANSSHYIEGKMDKFNKAKEILLKL